MTTVSVVVASYRRSWALPLSLGSLVKQTRRPEEVVVVLKPSGDGSEEVVEGFSKRLNIKLVTQREGNVVDAALLGIRKARGDLLIFLDDDALAEERWVEKYLRLFNALSDAGGIGGIVYKAFKARNSIIKVNEYFYVEKRPVIGPHRRPLEMFKGYCGFIADSGLQGGFRCASTLARDIVFPGVNMAWRREAIAGVEGSLSRAFRESRICTSNEQYLAVHARMKGYHVYRALDPEVSPIVWHIHHELSLQREPVKSEYWRIYDLSYNYWRLKALALPMSFPRYLLGLAIMSKRHPHVRLPAALHGLVRGAVFYSKARRSLTTR